MNQLTHEALLDLQLDDGSGISSSLLSVGQKQIFSLARVLLTKANILILDEASSSMDASTEVGDLRINHYNCFLKE